MSFSAFREAALSGNYKVISVDVFDTLLLRHFHPEHLRFKQIAAKQHKALISSGFPLRVNEMDFFLLRVMGARAAYRNTEPVNNVREASYDEIMDVILAAACVSKQSADLCLKTELEYEKSVLKPNSTLISTLRKASRSGMRVICISDIYLSSPNIEELISYHIPDSPIDAVYSSSDFRMAKSAGNLFLQVAQLENVQINDIIHCGDNAWSDVHKARENGVTAFHTPRSLLWRTCARTWRVAFDLYFGLLS